VDDGVCRTGDTDVEDVVIAEDEEEVLEVVDDVVDEDETEDETEEVEVAEVEEDVVGWEDVGVVEVVGVGVGIVTGEGEEIGAVYSLSHLQRQGHGMKLTW